MELNASDSFRAAGRRDRHHPAGDHRRDGETHYWIRIGGGAIDMGIGDAEAPDATITESYETAVASRRASCRR